MYEAVRVRVKLRGELGEVFDSVLGVKQGDPISPPLFGVFIEMLPEFIQAANNANLETTQQHGLPPCDWLDCCPDLEGFTLFYMLFADDLSLITTNALRLQNMLDCLSNFCTEFGVEVSIPKTEIIIFGRSTQIPSNLNFHFGTHTLRVVTSAKYLGLKFVTRGHIKCNEETLSAAGQRARFALQNKIKIWKHLSPNLQIRLFKALVLPVMSYGCQIWGVDYLGLPAPLTQGLVPTNPLENVLHNFLRFVSGTGMDVPLWVLLNEFSIQPLQIHFATCILRFWNHLRKHQVQNVMAAHTAKADIKLMLSGVSKCWSSKVIKFLIALGTARNTSFVQHEYAEPLFARHTQSPQDSSSYFWGLTLDVDAIISHLRIFWRDRTLTTLGASDPRTTTVYPKIQAYVQWVGLPDTPHPHTHCHLNRCTHVTLMRFRLGCWRFLEVNKDRRRSTGRRPRAQRLCRLCTAGMVEDEHHVLMSCSAYADIRLEFDYLFSNNSMTQVLGHTNQQAVAQCIARIGTRRESWDENPPPAHTTPPT
jgi:hypothetical protein